MVAYPVEELIRALNQTMILQPPRPPVSWYAMYEGLHMKRDDPLDNAVACHGCGSKDHLGIRESLVSIPVRRGLLEYWNYWVKCKGCRDTGPAVSDEHGKAGAVEEWNEYQRNVQKRA